jgi:hypothetical protein
MTRINNTRSSDLRESKAREEVEYTFEEQDVLHIPEAVQTTFRQRRNDTWVGKNDT